jgi:signal transduction histidine kinase
MKNRWLSNIVKGKVNVFSKMKVGMRVGLGFVVMLGVFIATSFFSLGIFNQSETSFVNYSTVSAEAVAILDIDRQVSELQRVILAYSNTGNAAAVARAKKSHHALVNNLSLINSSIDNQINIAILQSMMKILASFGENIDALVGASKRRSQLIDVSMAALVVDRSRQITELKNIAESRGDTKNLYNIYVINEQLLLAQVNATLFLANRKYTLQQAVKTSVALAKSHADQLYRSTGASAESQALAKALADNISAYEKVFYQAVQATRDYLFLVNVVMAGEASEFSTLSTRLKVSTLSILDSFTQSTKQRFGEARKTTALVIAIAIAIGFVLAFLIGRSISKPIREIAQTFEQLVLDKHDAEIPGLNRGDEIGQLANAANVFKEMNERTKKILQESQRLSSALCLRENELEERSLSLQKSNDELDNFAYIASHDLKSPLRAIDNLSKWIVEDCADILPVESLEHLNKMQQRVKRMETLLSDLLNYSRVGRVDVVVEAVNVVNLVEDVVALIDKPQAFVVNVSDSLPEITTQVSPLQQVFLNLFTNAIKYSDKQEGVIDVSSQPLSEGFVQFSVADNGPGIEAKYHQRIFQMFQTLTPRDVIESSGMGLAIIKKVVEGQGGEITVESELGQGCVFSFSWPVSKPT